MLKVRRLQNPEEFQQILGSYGLSAVGLIPFLEQPPHTEEPCSKFIVANLNTDPPLLGGRVGKRGGTEAVSADRLSSALRAADS